MTSLYPNWILCLTSQPFTDNQFIPKLDLFSVSTFYRRPVYTQTGFCLASQPLQTTSLYPNWILFSVSTIADDQFIPKLDLLCSVTKKTSQNSKQAPTNKLAFRQMTNRGNCKNEPKTISRQDTSYVSNRQNTQNREQQLNINNHYSQRKQRK